MQWLDVGAPYNGQVKDAIVKGPLYNGQVEDAIVKGQINKQASLVVR